MTGKIPVLTDPSDLPAKAYKWARDVNDILRALRLDTNVAILNTDAAVSAAVSAQTAISNQANQITGLEEIIVTPVSDPPVPTMPIVTSGMALVVATWDGSFVADGPDAPESNMVSSMVVYASLIDDPTLFFRMVAGPAQAGSLSFQASDLGANVGDTVYVRLRAVGYNGIEGELSESGSVVVAGVEEVNLDPSLVETITSVSGMVSASLDVPTPLDGVDKPIDALWYQYDVDNTVTSAWRWDGIDWLSMPFGDGALASLDAGKITAGILDAARIAAGSIVAEHIAVGAINAEHIASDTIEGNHIKAGVISVDKLEPGIGGTLDISANSSVVIAVGMAEDAQSTADGAQDNIDALQVYYSFTNDGAVISTPDSPYELWLKNDRIEMVASGIVIAYWQGGKMVIVALETDTAQVGNHIISGEIAGHTTWRPVV